MQFIMQILVAVKVFQSGIAVDAQPRTFDGTLIVSVSVMRGSEQDVKQLEVVSTSGVRLVDLLPRYRPIEGRQEYVVDCSDWAQGMYLVVVSDGKQTNTIKTVKVR